MLRITPITDKIKQQYFSQLCKSEYLVDCMAYQILSDDEFIGMVNFQIKGKCGYIMQTALVPDCRDYEAIEIAVRGVLNFIDLCSVKEVVYHLQNGYDKQTAEKIGFRTDSENGEYKINLEGFFKTPCKNCKN